MKNKISLTTIIITFVAIVVDLAVYIFLGLLLMKCDDFYEESKGEYWSWASMSTSEQLAYTGLNFWHLVNLLTFVYIVYKVYNIIRSKKQDVLQHRL